MKKLEPYTSPLSELASLYFKCLWPISWVKFCKYYDVKTLWCLGIVWGCAIYDCTLTLSKWCHLGDKNCVTQCHGRAKWFFESYVMVIWCFDITPGLVTIFPMDSIFFDFPRHRQKALGKRRRLATTRSRRRFKPWILLYCECRHWDWYCIHIYLKKSKKHKSYLNISKGLPEWMAHTHTQHTVYLKIGIGETVY